MKWGRFWLAMGGVDLIIAAVTVVSPWILASAGLFFIISAVNFKDSR